MLLISLIFFGIYMVAFNDKAVITKKEVIDDSKYIEDFDGMTSSDITNITSEPIISATIGPDKDSIYYANSLYGDIEKMTLRGANKEKIYREELGVPKKVLWASDSNMAIISYENGENFVRNYETGESIKLRNGMDNVVWTATGNRILYKYYNLDLNERTLNIANYNGDKWKKIANLPFRYADFISIPSSIFVAFWPVDKHDLETKLLTTNTINESNVTEIFSGKNGASFLYAPDGEHILMSSVFNGGKNITLGVFDSNGNNYNDFKIPTIIKKVVWSKDGKTVYYAQPTNIPNDVIWPEDYYENKFTTQDTFYKLDIESGKKERLIEYDEIKEKLDAVDLFLSPAEDALFFINKINGLLYKLKL